MSMVQTLVNIFSDAATDRMTRNLAGVLLRGAVEKSAFAPELVTQLRGLLLQLWVQETDALLLKRLAHIMAQSAQQSSWLELLPQVVSNASSNASAAQSALVSALLLIEVVAQYCPADVLTHVQVLGMFLSGNLGNPSSEVQVSCARACCACIVALEDEGAREAFKPAVQAIINIVGAALADGNETDATSITEYLVTIAELQPIFFKGNVDAVVQAMITVAKSDDLEFTTRSMALELMVTLSETAPALARRCPGLVQGLVPLAMLIMRDVEDTEEEWLAGKYEQEEPEDNYFVGEEAIERAAQGMGGRVLGPVVLNLVQSYSQNSDWTYRRAAVAALCRLAEGSTSAFKSYFDQALQFLLTTITTDPSARVRYQAAETIGRFAALFTANSKQFEKLLCTFVAPLTHLMGEAGTCDKLRGHCTSALINLTNPENCEEESLTESNLLEPLLTALVVCLQSASLEVQPYCLDLLGCVAQVSGEVFAAYYPSFMPGVKQILLTAQGSPDPQLMKLRGKAMNTIGLVGDAVGAELFTPDAIEVMHMLLQDLSSCAGSGPGNLHDQDVAFDYILPACARISKALGAAFKPFVPAVMAPLLSGANQVITCTIEDAQEQDQEGETIQDEETGLESAILPVAGVKKRVTMNTYAVHQKDQSARMLYEFAQALKGEMHTHLVPAMEVIINMVTDKHSSDVRASASLALSKLFEATVDAVAKGYPLTASGNVHGESAALLAQMLQLCLNKLLESLKGEINAAARGCSASCLEEILQVCFDSAEEAVDGSRSAATVLIRPDAANSKIIVTELLTRCTESVNRRTKFEAAFASNEGLEAEDKEAFEEQVEEEDEVLTNLVSSIGILLKLHSDTHDVMPVFDAAVVPLFAPYLVAPGAAQAKKQHCDHFQIVATCMFDDIMEYGGQHACKYISQCVNQMLENVATSDNSVVRQCSAYGIAQIVRMHPDTLLQALDGDISCITNAMVSLINRETEDDDGEEDLEGEKENAVFALGLMVTLPAFRQCVQSMKTTSASLMTMTQSWLAALPLKTDGQESKCSSFLLCQAVAASDPTVLGGAGCSNLAVILRIFADILMQAEKLSRGAIDLDDEVMYAHKDTVTAVVQCMQGLAGAMSVCPAAAVQTAFAGLSAPHQAVLNKVLV